MATLKLNKENEVESIGTFKLSKEKTPRAYENKIKELIHYRGMEREQAERYLNESSFELELYYHEGNGLFAVEVDAIECGANIFSPYSGEKYEDCD